MDAARIAELRAAFDRDELSLVSEGYRKNNFGGFDEWSTRHQGDLLAIFDHIASLTKELEEARRDAEARGYLRGLRAAVVILGHEVEALAPVLEAPSNVLSRSDQKAPE